MKIPKYLYGFILFIILLRLPVLHFWNNYLTGDDAALYMETAINYAEEKDYSASVLRHIKDEEYLKRYIEVNGIRDRMEWIPPLYILLLSFIYRITGEAHFMSGINIFNLLLFCTFLILYLKFLIKVFRDKQSVIFFSILYMGLNFIAFEFTFGAHMESLYLLSFFLVFLIHILMFESEKPWYIRYVLYPLVLTLFLFSKYSSIPFVAAFLLHILFKRRIKDFLLISIIVVLIAAPWMFVRSYLISGHPLAQMLRGDFPFTNAGLYTGFANLTFYSLYSFIRELSWMFNQYVSIDYFFFLFPFVLFFLFDKNKNSIFKEISIILVLFSFVFFGFIFRNANGRYQLLLLIPVIPFAIDIMVDYYHSLKNISVRRIIAGILLVLFMTIQLLKITEFYNSVRNASEYREKVITGSLELVDRSGIPENITILVNVEGFNVFSNRKVVLASDKLDVINRNELFEAYNVKYVLFAEGERHLNRNIFRDLELVDSMQDDIGIYLYKVAL